MRCSWSQLLYGRVKALFEIFQNLPGALVNFYIQFLGAKFSSAYNASTGASKYIKIVKNHYPPNFQNFPTFVLPVRKYINNNTAKNLYFEIDFTFEYILFKGFKWLSINFESYLELS